MCRLWDNLSRWSLVTCLPAVLLELLGTYWTHQHFFFFLLWEKGPSLLLPPRSWQSCLPADVAAVTPMAFRKRGLSAPRHSLAAAFLFSRSCISSFSCLSLPISCSLICLIPCLHCPHSMAPETITTSTPKKVFLDKML